MEAVSLNHARILGNLIVGMHSRLRPKDCRGLPGPLRVRGSDSKYVYPDFQIVCGKAQVTDEHADTVTNPKVVVEILSPSTADYDHGAKFELYRQVPSIEEYVLISQSSAKVEVFTKQSEHTWSLTIFDGPEEPVRLQAVGVEFPLAELYEDVEFS